jgi:type II secretory pathway component GspD/PulD (secretin)
MKLVALSVSARKPVRGAHRFAVACIVLLAFAATAYAQPQDQNEEGAAPEPGKFTIHFENVELPTFIKFISKVTGKKFVFSDRVAGTVTVISPVEVTEREAFTMFESVLAVRGLTMIEDGVVTRIVPLKEALTSGGAVLHRGPRRRLRDSTVSAPPRRCRRDRARAASRSSPRKARSFPTPPRTP